VGRTLEYAEPNAHVKTHGITGGIADARLSTNCYEIHGFEANNTNLIMPDDSLVGRLLEEELIVKVSSEDRP
jgi:hypothetical protein